MHSVVQLTILSAFSAQAYAEAHVVDRAVDNLLSRADNVRSDLNADFDASVLAKGAPTEPPTPPPPKNPFAALFGGGGKSTPAKGKGKGKAKSKVRAQPQVTVYAPQGQVVPGSGPWMVDGKPAGQAFKDVIFGEPKEKAGKTRALPPARPMTPLARAPPMMPSLVRGPTTRSIRGPPIR